MKWVIIFSAVLILVIGGMVGFYFFGPPAPSGQTGNGSNFSSVDPFANSGQQNGSNAGTNQNQMNAVTKKVLADIQKTETALPAGMGNYYELNSSQDATSTAYTVLYVDADNSLQVILNEQPIGRARKEAENFLLKRLNLTENEACTLNYHVTVPYDIDQKYGGASLGFSFCSGSVQLSEI